MRRIRGILINSLFLIFATTIIALICYKLALVFNLPKIGFEYCLTFTTAVITLSFSFAQYMNKKESDRTNLLLSYNKRFISDEKIQSVISYLQIFDENRNNPSFNPRDIKEPSGADFIFFARFFEELETIIDVNNIDKTYVCRLYGYYAVEAYKYHKKKIGNVDNDNSWYLFRKFCKSMIEIERDLDISHE